MEKKKSQIKTEDATIMPLFKIGSGKTTLMRDLIARVSSDSSNLILIVDTKEKSCNLYDRNRPE